LQPGRAASPALAAPSASRPERPVPRIRIGPALPGARSCIRIAKPLPHSIQNLALTRDGVFRSDTAAFSDCFARCPCLRISAFARLRPYLRDLQGLPPIRTQNVAGGEGKNDRLHGQRGQKLGGVVWMGRIRKFPSVEEQHARNMDGNSFRCQRPEFRGNARKLGAVRQRPENIGSHRTAWWWMHSGSNRSPAQNSLLYLDSTKTREAVG